MYTVNWLVFGELRSKQFKSLDAAKRHFDTVLYIGVSYASIEIR